MTFKEKKRSVKSFLGPYSLGRRQGLFDQSQFLFELGKQIGDKTDPLFGEPCVAVGDHIFPEVHIVFPFVSFNRKKDKVGGIYLHSDKFPLLLCP